MSTSQHPDHDHDHASEHHHDHPHGHGHGLRSRLRDLLQGHTHDPAEQVDSTLEGSVEGTRALAGSLLVLGVTAIAQAVVVVFSGSVALLGDTLHNFADALTAVPLWIAFRLGRRAPNERFTYGYGRFEDLAGVVVVLVIAVSAIAAGYEAIDRLINPRTVDHLIVVAAAGVIGFIGNEIAAQMRIRTGRRIGSDALVADGLHARTDGLTSLAVVAGVIGVALGWQAADPIAGLLIMIAIVGVLRRAVRLVFRRLLDAVDPELYRDVTRVVESTSGVIGLDQLRLRWVGHRLHVEADITVAADRSLAAAHDIAHEVEHQLLHQVPRVQTVIVHPSPAPSPGRDPHAVVAHHAEGLEHEHH
jgi:cation diffusion facilitator family transporter